MNLATKIEIHLRKKYNLPVIWSVQSVPPDNLLFIEAIGVKINKDYIRCVRLVSKRKDSYSLYDVILEVKTFKRIFACEELL